MPQLADLRKTVLIAFVAFNPKGLSLQFNQNQQKWIESPIYVRLILQKISRKSLQEKKITFTCKISENRDKIEKDQKT